MQDIAALSTVVSALWLTVAILAGGYARTRNRSAWTWFVLTLFFGPIAAFLLVVWPARELPDGAAPPAIDRPTVGSSDHR